MAIKEEVSEADTLDLRLVLVSFLSSQHICSLLLFPRDFQRDPSFPLAVALILSSLPPSSVYCLVDLILQVTGSAMSVEATISPLALPVTSAMLRVVVPPLTAFLALGLVLSTVPAVASRSVMGTGIAVSAMRTTSPRVETAINAVRLVAMVEGDRVEDLVIAVAMVGEEVDGAETTTALVLVRSDFSREVFVP